MPPGTNPKMISAPMQRRRGPAHAHHSLWSDHAVAEPSAEAIERVKSVQVGRKCFFEFSTHEGFKGGGAFKINVNER